MIFRSFFLRAASTIVRAQPRVFIPKMIQTPATNKLTPQRFRDMVLQKSRNPSIADCLGLLATATDSTLISDRSVFRDALSAIVRKVTDDQLGKFDAESLTRFIDGASDMNVLSVNQVNAIFRMVKSRNVNQDPANIHRGDKWEKCVLSLWAASLWHGFPTSQYHELCLALLKQEGLKWSMIARLAWCVENDAVTKSDPSITNRADELLESRLSNMSLPHLADLATLRIPREDEYSVARAKVLEKISSELTTVDKLTLDDRIPLQLLSAWLSGVSTPPNREFYDTTIALCINNRKNLHLMLDVLAKMGMPESLDVASVRSVVTENWNPSGDQLTSMCMSFAALGFNDVQSTYFMARQIELALQNPSSGIRSENLWKIGAWFSYLQLTASESTLGALNDAFKDLTATIASGMWDNQGRFVRKELKASRLAPADRSMRKVILESLISLGITAMRNIHVVNTPFVAPMFLPDSDLVIVFDPSDCEVMRAFIEARGYHIRVLETSEWERKYMEQSQDDFLANLLSAIQLS